MNKSDLVIGAMAATGLSRREASRVVNIILHAVTHELADGGQVRLLGFGSFSVARRGARVVRNPRSGDLLSVPARNLVRFRPGKALKKAVNN